MCKKGYRRCINGRCIKHSSWCDGTDDCGDGSDELPCNSKWCGNMCVSTNLNQTWCSLDVYRSSQWLCAVLPSFNAKMDPASLTPVDATRWWTVRMPAMKLTVVSSNLVVKALGCRFKSHMTVKPVCCSLGPTDCSSYYLLGVKGMTFQRCEFTTLCFAPSWRCDGSNDCGDFSDERNCPGQTNTFMHISHINIQSKWTIQRHGECFFLSHREEKAEMSSELLCVSERPLYSYELDVW